MNKWFPKILYSFIVVAGSTGLRAADQPAERQPKRDDAPKLAIEAREAFDGRKTNAGPSREERGKRREEFNKLTPEEREAKRKELKERLEKRIAELRIKRTNGALTSQETRELERREQILKRFEQTPVPVAEPAAPAPK
jgi:hypothetical protein